MVQRPSPHSESSSSSSSRAHLHGRVQKVGGPRISLGKHRPHTDGTTGMDNSVHQTMAERVAVQDSGHHFRLVRTLQNGEDLLQVLHQLALPLPRVGPACRQIGAALLHQTCNSQGLQSVAVLAVVVAAVVVADAVHHLVAHTAGGASEDCRMHKCLKEMKVRRGRLLQKPTGGMQRGINNNQLKSGKQCRTRPCKTELSEASN
mmetsp:Transcript_121638/g.242322  ORF Transcript_121638/g.242322 Transcript_121638/m.242322 type:complete len:204 (+) Transcript_121638:2776-3387(+)